jgi:hypothetical protein
MKTLTAQELYNIMRRDQKSELPCWNKKKYHRQTAELVRKFTPKSKW